MKKTKIKPEDIKRVKYKGKTHYLNNVEIVDGKEIHTIQSLDRSETFIVDSSETKPTVLPNHALYEN